MEVIIGQIYRHFKGNLYKVICIAKDSEDERELVIYQALYGDNQIYARALDMFTSKVDKVKYPDATQEYRFEIWDGLNIGAAPRIMPTENTPKETQEAPSLCDDENEELNIDPGVLKFLDSKNFTDKLEILQNMHGNVTESMINTMAFSIDLELNQGTVEEMYGELLNAVSLRERFECSRLR